MQHLNIFNRPSILSARKSRNKYLPRAFPSKTLPPPQLLLLFFTPFSALTPPSHKIKPPKHPSARGDMWLVGGASNVGCAVLRPGRCFSPRGHQPPISAPQPPRFQPTPDSGPIGLQVMFSFRLREGGRGTRSQRVFLQASVAESPLPPPEIHRCGSCFIGPPPNLHADRKPSWMKPYDSDSPRLIKEGPGRGSRASPATSSGTSAPSPGRGSPLASRSPDAPSQGPFLPDIHSSSLCFLCFPISYKFSSSFFPHGVSDGSS